MGREKDQKFKFSMGLAFNEDSEMKMLGDMASEGWIFSKFSGLGYIFRKGEKQRLTYCVDMHSLKNGEEDQYFSLFQEAGWAHVCSSGKYYHFFSALPGTRPIYTDKETLVEKYRKFKGMVYKSIIAFFMLFLISFLAQMLFKSLWDNESILFAAGIIMGGSLGMLLALAAAAVLINLRIKRLRKSAENS